MVDLNNPKPVTPLAGMVSPTAGITLTETPYVGKVNIRGDAGDPKFADAVAKVVGVALPIEPNTVADAGIAAAPNLPVSDTGEHTAAGGSNVVYWLGPDEWLVHTPPNGESRLVEDLRTALDGIHAAVTDVSDYYVVIDVTGPHARDVLARGCPLDLHASKFDTGQCAQSVFAHASILLHQTTTAPSYRIQVRWTYAQYLWSYLADAAKQWAA